ncbi:MAG TPA: mechanosensitive ion channel [Alcaligenaceae bacterium]|nr:mechanosensitive ion channel [Alcaligenaceae bacterium]
MQITAALIVLITVYVLLHWGTSVVLRLFVGRFLKTIGKHDWLGSIQRRRVREHLSASIPLFITATGLGLIPVGQNTLEFISRLVLTVSLFFLFRAISALLLVFEDMYEGHKKTQTHSIKGYLQLVRIVFWCLAFIVLASALVNKSPLLMISGLGALSAVLLLVFKDTLLSLVASAQISTNDMLRIGDWIEMPQAGADGEVIDVALHTVKVQNWDKTVTTIPTYKLFSESYKNWRQMFESGGRRIKRSLRIDAGTVRFLTDEEINALGRFSLIHDYLNEKKEKLAEANQRKEGVNRRRLTNLGTFRAYANAYIRQKEGVHPGMTLMVRMLEPTAAGIPLEVYCFSSKTAWVEYEGIQADIFDHLIAILPEMFLRLYQSPSGADLSGAFNPQNMSKADLEQMAPDA